MQKSHQQAMFHANDSQCDGCCTMRGKALRELPFSIPATCRLPSPDRAAARRIVRACRDARDPARPVNAVPATEPNVAEAVFSASPSRPPAACARRGSSQTSACAVGPASKGGRLTTPSGSRPKRARQGLSENGRPGRQERPRRRRPPRACRIDAARPGPTSSVWPAHRQLPVQYPSRRFISVAGMV